MIKKLNFYKKEEEIEINAFPFHSIVGADTTILFPDGFSEGDATGINMAGHYILLGAKSSATSLHNEVVTLADLSKKMLNDYNVKSLVAGTGIKVTNNSGAWTIENTGGSGDITEVKHDNSLVGKGTDDAKLGINSAVYKVEQLQGGSNITITETATGSGIWKIDATGDLAAAVWGDISGAIADQTDLWSNTYTKVKGNYTYVYSKDLTTSSTTSTSGYNYWTYKTGTDTGSVVAGIDMNFCGTSDIPYYRLIVTNGVWTTGETPTYQKKQRYLDAIVLGNSDNQVIAVADLDSGSFKLDGGKIKTIASASTAWGQITGTITAQTDLMNWGASIISEMLSTGFTHTGVTGTNYSKVTFGFKDTSGAQQGITFEGGTHIGSTDTPVYFAYIGGTTLGYPAFTLYNADGSVIKELNPLSLSSTTTTYIPALKDFDLTNSFEVTNGKICTKSGGNTVTHDATLTGTGISGSPLGLNLDTTVVTKTLAATDKWSVRALKAGSNILISQDTDKSGEWTISSSADPGTTVFWGNMTNPTTGTYKDLRAQTDLMEYLWGGTLPATIPAIPTAGNIGYLAAVVGNTYSITKNSVKGTAALFLSKPDTSVVNDGLLRMIIQNDNSNIKESRIDFGQVMKDASSATCYFSVKSYKTDGTTVNLERKIDAYPISSTSTANLIALGDFDTTEFEVVNNKITTKNSGSTKVDLNFTHTADFPYDWAFLDKTNKYIWGIKTTNDSNSIIFSGNTTSNPYTLSIKGSITRVLSGATISALTDTLAIAATDLSSTDFSVASNKIRVNPSLFTPYKVKELTAGTTNVTIAETATGSGNWKISVVDAGISIGDFDPDQFTTKKNAQQKDIVTLKQLVKVTSTDGKTSWQINNNPTDLSYGFSFSKDMSSTTTPILTLEQEGAAGTTAWGEITGNLMDQHDLCYYMPEAIDDTLGAGTADPSHFVSELKAGTGIALSITDVSDNVSSGGKKKGKVVTFSVDTSIHTSVYTDNKTITGDGSTTDTPLTLKFPMSLPATAVITIG